MMLTWCRTRHQMWKVCKNGEHACAPLACANFSRPPPWAEGDCREAGVGAITLPSSGSRGTCARQCASVADCAFATFEKGSGTCNGFSSCSLDPLASGRETLHVRLRCKHAASERNAHQLDAPASRARDIAHRLRALMPIWRDRETASVQSDCARNAGFAIEEEPPPPPLLAAAADPTRSALRDVALVVFASESRRAHSHPGPIRCVGWPTSVSRPRPERLPSVRGSNLPCRRRARCGSHLVRVHRRGRLRRHQCERGRLQDQAL